MLCFNLFLLPIMNWRLQCVSESCWPETLLKDFHRMSYSVNFAKFFKTTFSQNISRKQGSTSIPDSIYLLKVNKRNTKTRCEICSKLTITLAYFTPRSSVSIVNFEHVIAGWDASVRRVKME